MPTSVVKPFKTYQELVALLEQRGMIIEDTQKAERKLAQVGYYRLSGFFYPCREFDLDSHGQQKICPKRKTPLRLATFTQGTSFNKVFELYLFDKKLRSVLMNAIERVEIYMRSIIAHELSSITPLAYQNTNFINPKYHKTYTTQQGEQRNSWIEWQSKHLKKINVSREECIVWHTRSQSPLPFWVVIEAWDFGTMSKYFEMLLRRHQNTIAEKISCSNPQEMIAWLKELNTLRNRCAHHSRIWNQKTSNPLQMSSIPSFRHLNSDGNACSRLFGQIVILWHFLSTIDPNSHWIDDVATVVNTKPNLPNCNFKTMGFPDEAGFPLQLFT